MNPDRRYLLIVAVLDYLGNVGAEELADILVQPEDAEGLAKQLRDVVKERREAARQRRAVATDPVDAHARPDAARRDPDPAP